MSLSSDEKKKAHEAGQKWAKEESEMSYGESLFHIKWGSGSPLETPSDNKELRDQFQLGVDNYNETAARNKADSFSFLPTEWFNNDSGDSGGSSSGSSSGSDDYTSSDDDSSYSSSSDDSDYSSSSYTPSSTPSVSKKKDDSSSIGFNPIPLMMGIIWLIVLTPTCSTKNEGKNLEQNKPAVHSEALAVPAETEPEIVEPPPTVQNAPPQETRASPGYQTNEWEVEVVVTDEIFTEVPVPQEARFIAIDCPSDGLVKVFHSYAQQGIIYDCALPFNIGEVQYLRIGFSAKGDTPVLVRVGFSY